MKSYITALLFIYSITATKAQTNPVSWKFDLISIDAKSYEVVCSATIKGNWVIYSSKMENKGPVPTSIEITEGTPINSIIEPLKVEKAYDDLFEMDVLKFGKKAIFKQKVSVSDSQTQIRGHIQFMTCDGSKCLPPTKVPFSLALN